MHASGNDFALYLEMFMWTFSLMTKFRHDDALQQPLCDACDVKGRKCIKAGLRMHGVGFVSDGVSTAGAMAKAGVCRLLETLHCVAYCAALLWLVAACGCCFAVMLPLTTLLTVSLHTLRKPRLLRWTREQF